MTNGGGIGAAAVGPAGIILLGQDGADGEPFVIGSIDGATWTRTDLPSDSFGGGIPARVVAGGPGYVALGYEVSLTQPGGVSPVIWLSDDGVHWIADPSPSGWLRGQHVRQLLSDASSLYIGGTTYLTSGDGVEWTTWEVPDLGRVQDLSASSTRMAVLNETGLLQSLGGTSWTTLELPTETTDLNPDPHPLQVYDVALGDNGLLAVGEALNAWLLADDSWYFDRPFSLWLTHDFSTWTKVDSRQFTPTQQGIGHFTPRAGGGFLAFSVEEQGRVTRLWVSEDGADWVGQDLELSTWGNIEVDQFVWLRDVPIAVGRDSHQSSVVIVGRPQTHRDVALPSATAVMPEPAPPPAEALLPCPRVPTTVRDLLALSPGDGPRCFGDDEIVVSGWYEEYPAEFCGLGMETRFWLTNSGCSAVYAMPSRNWDYSDIFVVYIDPAGERPPSGRGWYTIRGHFDDAAASSCGAAEQGNVVQHVPPLAELNVCRDSFVGTGFVKGRNP